nr:uncharacterized protein LOC112545154 [Pelodiscus sinensis]|eukprot:XP_025038502.1 uncharacterized protein LOC112545154 [Pelodiscus sinensis]
MGCSHGHRKGPRPLVLGGDAAAYQPSRAVSGISCMQAVQEAHKRHNDKNSHRQHRYDVLCEQARGCSLLVSLCRGGSLMEVVHSKRHLSRGFIFTRGEQHHRRCTEQTFLPRPQVGNSHGRPPTSFPPLGSPGGRSLCHAHQCEMQSLLLQSRSGRSLPGRCVSSSLGTITVICIPPCCTHSQGTREDCHRQGTSAAHSPCLAQTAVVFNPPAAVDAFTAPISSPTRPAVATGQLPSSSKAGHPTPNSLDGRWFSTSKMLCSDQVKGILLYSRKDSTRKTYLSKWSRFTRWHAPKDLDPLISPLNVVLEYILQLQATGLSISSLRVHAAAIAAFHHHIEGKSVFFHPMMTRFFKGLINLNLPYRPPPPAWSLDLVLDVLTRPPFEPLATVLMPVLTMKVLFLLAITSARRVSELAALMSSPPYTVFTKDAVTLRSHPAFLPKVCTEFHINEPIVLPCFYPEPHTSRHHALLHTLDARRALVFYIDRTRDIRKTDRLIVSTSGHSKGQALSAQRISKLVVSCITTCYDICKKPLLSQPRAHSTRAMATSTAFVRGVPLRDICRAATWSSNTTFSRHYAIVQRFSPGLSSAAKPSEL